MNAFLQEMVDEEIGMQMTPMIDMVFLLLVYFLVTSSLKPQEADMGIHLPGDVKVSDTKDLPDEQIIEIDAQNRINFNGTWYEDPTVHDLPELVGTLLEYRRIADASNGKVVITIDADNESSHQRSIDVMNACAAAGIKDVSFMMGE
jgi:biopolymer transport protein ExbD